MLYVYAITEGSSVAFPGNGLEGRTLESQSHDGLAVVFSRHESRVEPSPENLWMHERVVESLMRDRALLPSRFGTMLRDEEMLRETIAAHATDLSAGLERVRGCVELGLRVLWPRQQAGSTKAAIEMDHPNGRAYMLARLEEERRRKAVEQEAQSVFDRLHDELAPLVRDGTRRRASASQWMLTAAYLVERDAVAGFRERLRETATRHSDLRVLCTGPWPPYNFVPVLRHDPAAEVRHA